MRTVFTLALSPPKTDQELTLFMCNLMCLLYWAKLGFHSPQSLPSQKTTQDAELFPSSPHFPCTSYVVDG